MLWFAISSPLILAQEIKKNDISGQAEQEQKKLLDAVKNGVVMIEVNAHLSLERGAKNNWLGSGFLVDKKNGIIATNKHVAGEMAVCTYEIKFSTGVKVSAQFLYADPHYDVAFLRIDPKKIPETCVALEFAGESPKVHQEIYAMGYSAGDEFSTYKGTIFTIYDNLGPFNEQSFRFSGMTVGGASGSPVFNKTGKVMGILYGGKFVSGAALPFSYVERPLRAIQSLHFPKRNSVGAVFSYQDLELVQAAGSLPKDAEILYKKHFPDAQNKILVIYTRLVNSPAAKHFQPGDILWTMNGKMVGPHLKDIEEHIDGKKTVHFSVYRRGKLVEFTAHTYSLEQRNVYRFVSFAGCVWYENHELQRMLTGEDRNGVYISSTDPTSPLKEVFKNNIWLSRPIRITHINGHPIETLDDLQKTIGHLKKHKILSITYIDYMGEVVFGDNISADRQPREAIVKYNNSFDTPKNFLFNRKTLQWDVTSL